jgi:hypothetical protein
MNPTGLHAPVDARVHHGGLCQAEPCEISGIDLHQPVVARSVAIGCADGSGIEQAWRDPAFLFRDGQDHGRRKAMLALCGQPEDSGSSQERAH